MKTPPEHPNGKTDLVLQAWIGDAVLSLYVREKILREDGSLDGEKYVRMTSNQFLGSIGEPTKVEAQIGQVYTSAGLVGAFAWIEAQIIPIFEKQELNRARKLGGKSPLQNR